MNIFGVPQPEQQCKKVMELLKNWKPDQADSEDGLTSEVNEIDHLEVEGSTTDSANFALDAGEEYV